MPWGTRVRTGAGITTGKTTKERDVPMPHQSGPVYPHRSRNGIGRTGVILEESGREF